MEELEASLAEVVAMLREDGEPAFEAERFRTQTMHVGKRPRASRDDS